jgi:hypothetical protein
LVEAPQGPVGLLGQGPVVVGMATADLGDIGPGGQSFGHEHADGLQHPWPAAELGAVEVDQAVAGQGLGQLQGPVLIEAGDLGGGLEGPAVDEAGHGFQ